MTLKKRMTKTEKATKVWRILVNSVWRAYWVITQ